ncbi:MAG TPA: right-handed parallel beta-helix repeat-containing protein [Steroidobacteraceae bacterium]|nr:right-handed parallel beta-helix repeat-containing protein [Steroidobacteraceae bacterium]
MKARPVMPRGSRGLLLAATVACGLVLLAAAIASRAIDTHDPQDGRAAARLVVTSADDAGPGTLRDAILAADRLSTHCHIVIESPRIVIESGLPALINPHGIDIEALPRAGTIDAARAAKGPAIEIKSPRSSLAGLHVVHARDYGILVDAPGADLTSVTVTDSKVGILLSAGASGAIVRTSLLQHDDTGIIAEPDIRHITLASDIFRLNTRAGLWFVGAAKARRAARDAPAQEEPLIRVIDTVFEKNATGVVLANEATLLRKDRFIDNGTALNVLGGAAGVEDCEIRGSQADAVSVSSGRSVVLAHNVLVDNRATALIVRDSEVRVESNTLSGNGLGLVLIGGPGDFTPLVKGNQIIGSRGDGITLIGGGLLLKKNRLLGNHGAGLRPLDLIQGQVRIKAAPRLDGNLFRANGLDIAPTRAYRLSGAS